jgi:hypothetical protein
MASEGDKWIRSLKDNPAGKVVEDPNGSRWEWEAAEDDGTSRLLKKLQNDELAIEQTDLVPGGVGRKARSGSDPARRDRAVDRQRRKKPGARDAGGGFNPYDSSGKPSRR